MQTQVLYAPFVKASDKIKKDVADLSLADFHPQRFALNYDPPMISKYFHQFNFDDSFGILGALDWQALPPQDEVETFDR